MHIPHVRKSLQVEPGSFLDEWLNTIGDREAFLVRDGVEYRVLRVGAPDASYPNYDEIDWAEVESAYGSWADVDEAIIADLLRGCDEDVFSFGPRC